MMMINLNSKEGYLSLMVQARALEKNVSLAEEGKAGSDFPEQMKTLSALRQAVRNRTSRGGIPLQLQGIHRVLDATLQELSKRVEAVTRKMNVASSLPQDAMRARGSLTAMQIAGGTALAGAAAFCFAQLWPATSKPNLQPSYPNPPPQNNGNVPAPDVSNKETPIRNGFCEVPPLLGFNASGLLEIPTTPAETLNTFPLPDQDGTPTGEPFSVKQDLIPKTSPFTPGPNLTSNLERERSTVDLIADQPATVPIGPKATYSGAELKGVLDNRITTETGETVHQISCDVLNSVLLGGLLLARQGINSAMPLLVMAGLHRGYHIVRLSLLSDALKNHTPGVVGYLESAAREYSRMESMMPISTSRMLESMTSIDRWAVVGLMELVRNIPFIQGFALAHPMGWRVLQVTPFFIGAWEGNGTRSKNLTFSNGTTVIAPGDDKSLSGYLQDVGYLGYIYLSGHALNEAAPLLYLALSTHVYNIVRLCNVTEPLKAQMPLLAEAMERAARSYSWFEEKMPASTGKMLQGMTSMDSWALVGLADLIRKVPGVQMLAGRIPVLSHLIANDRGWSFTRYTPIFLGGVLQVLGLGLNIQQRLLG